MVEGLIALLERTAGQNKLQRITLVELRIGELSDLVDECIQVYFDMAGEGTVCEGAKLVFTHERAMLRCPVCGKTFRHEKSFQCPSCGASIVGAVDENYVCSYCGNLIMGVIEKKW